MAKIFAPCPLMPNRKTEIEFEENRKEWLYYFCQAKGIHTRLVPQEICPVLLGIGRGFYTLMKVLLFFSSCEVSKQLQLPPGNSATRSIVPEVVGL